MSIPVLIGESGQMSNPDSGPNTPPSGSQGSSGQGSAAKEVCIICWLHLSVCSPDVFVSVACCKEVLMLLLLICCCVVQEHAAYANIAGRSWMHNHSMPNIGSNQPRPMVYKYTYM